jgi:hypothetical protein
MNRILVYFSVLVFIVILILYHEYEKIKHKCKDIEKFEASANFVQSEGGLTFDDLEQIDNTKPFYNVQNSLKNLKGFYLQAKSHNTHFVTSTAIKDQEIDTSIKTQ